MYGRRRVELECCTALISVCWMLVFWFVGGRGVAGRIYQGKDHARWSFIPLLETRSCLGWPALNLSWHSTLERIRWGQSVLQAANASAYASQTSIKQ